MKMIERTLWHPVASVAELTEAPLARTLLGEPLVLWRDAGGVPHAWADRCPHRGARLSLGCVREGQLECPYHGWRFEGGGRVVRVPALPAFEPPATHRATTRDAVERHGMVWVRLDAAGVGVERVASAAADESNANANPKHAPDIPPFEPEPDPRLRKLICGPYDVASSAPRIVENFLDMAHFGFVHEGWLGSREHTAIAAYDVAETPTGLVATRCQAWQPQSSVQATGGAQVEYTYEVNAPFSAVLTKVPEASAVAIAGFREAIALYVCPVTEEASRVWFRLAVTDFDSPEATLQDFQRTIFLQDRPVLESQSPKRLPIFDTASDSAPGFPANFPPDSATVASPVKELHSAADRSSTAYRRYLRRRGITFGVC